MGTVLLMKILGIKEDCCMKKIYAIMMMAAGLVACSREEMSQIVVETEGQTYTMSVDATKGIEDINSKALSIDDSGAKNVLNATWAEGEAVTVYNVTRSADLSGTLTAQSSGASTVLKGTLTGTVEPGDQLKLKFLSPSYASQTGTLEYIAANCDYAEATVTVTDASTPSVTTSAANFVNQQAIVKFTLKQKVDNSDLEIPAATALTINDGTNDYTVTPTSATNELFVAIPATGTVNLSTTIGGISYSYEKTGAGLLASKYYEITVKMNRVLVNLASITGNITLLDDDIVTGTLGSNRKISIADGATVTLNGVNINGSDTWSTGNYAGLNCLGNATIILADGTTNTVKGFNSDYPGIHVPSGSTLTIQGTGSLNASSKGYGAGIGGGWSIACGNITINGGTITATGGYNSAGIGCGKTSCGNISITGGTVEATGGMNAAGIGGGADSSCGNISITGGTVTAAGGSYGAGIGSGCRQSSSASCGIITISSGSVTATGGGGSAGIGSGSNASCGDITIENTVTSVTATKGDSAQNSIGKGYNGTCGTVTFGDATVYNGSAWSPNPMVAGKYGGLTLAISTTTNTNDTWTLTPPSAPAGVVAVDLGLPSGTLWASCNVGATSPEEFGDYFAWGETAPYYATGHSNDENCYDWVSYSKSGYNWTSYSYATNNDNTRFNKYTASENSYATSGTADGLTVLQAADDAATANWGSEWCTPTKEQWHELQNYTTYDWVSSTVIKIYKSADPSKYILLPTAGFWRGNGYLYQGTQYGFYWSSSLYYEQDEHYPYDITSYDPRHAWFVMFSYSSGIGWYGDYPNAHDEDERIYRCNGMPIRPVRAPQP